jgi:hypothetical protein
MRLDGSNVSLRIFQFWRLPTLVARPWRLVRELDAFDDARCEAFVRDVLWVRRTGLLAAFPIALIVGMTLTVWASEIAYDHPKAAWASRDEAVGRLTGVLFGVAMICITVSAAFTPYMLLLRWGLGRQIARAGCPSCGYTMLGLPLLTPDDDYDPHSRVKCPECGTIIVLEHHGLRPEDVMTGVVQGGVQLQANRGTVDMLVVLSAVIALSILSGWVLTGRDGWLQAFLISLLAVSMIAGRRFVRTPT